MTVCRGEACCGRSAAPLARRSSARARRRRRRRRRPPSTITNPPRDFGPNGAPTTYFTDPDILVVDPAFGGLVQVNSSIKRLWIGALWAEGPAWNSVGRYLIWSDIPNNVQMRWLEDDGHVTVFRNPSNNSNGNTFDFQGRQLSCEHLTRRVVRYEHDGSVTVIADAFEGKRLNSPNDVVAHPDGSYWFTDPPYGGQLYEGQPDAAGGPTNAAGRLNPKLGQPPEAGSMKRELPTSVYRVDAKGARHASRDRGAGAGSERARILTRLQAAVRRLHGEGPRRHRRRRQRRRAGIRRRRRHAVEREALRRTSRSTASNAHPTASAATSTAISGARATPAAPSATTASRSGGPTASCWAASVCPKCAATSASAGRSAIACSWPRASRSMRSTSIPRARDRLERMCVAGELRLEFAEC